jgi:hypothetical protein
MSVVFVLGCLLPSVTLGNWSPWFPIFIGDLLVASFEPCGALAGVVVVVDGCGALFMTTFRWKNFW